MSAECNLSTEQARTQSSSLLMAPIFFCEIKDCAHLLTALEGPEFLGEERFEIKIGMSGKASSLGQRKICQAVLRVHLRLETEASRRQQ